MITMSYNEARSIARNRELVMSLVDAKLTFRTGYNLRKILDKIGQAAQEFDLYELSKKKELADELAEKNEDGSLKTVMPDGATSEDERVILFSDENRAIAGRRMMEAVRAFGHRILKINRDKVNLMNENVALRPIDLPILDLFVADPEEMQPQEAPEAATPATVTEITGSAAETHGA